MVNLRDLEELVDNVRTTTNKLGDFGGTQYLADSKVRLACATAIVCVLAVVETAERFLPPRCR